MFDFETINHTHTKIRELSRGRDKAEFLHEVVEFLAEALKLYFTAVYLADEKREFLVLHAGSGTFGRKLLKYGHKLMISDSRYMVGHEAATVYLNEIRLAVLQEGKLFAWNVSTDGISQIEVGKVKEFLVGSPMLPDSLIEICLPLQVNGKAFGVLQLTLDRLFEISENQVAGLQNLADQITSQLIEYR